MSWGIDASIAAVAGHSQTNPGRIIAGLSASNEAARKDLAGLLLATVAQHRDPDAAAFLLQHLPDGAPQTQSTPVEVPTLDPKRPQYTRPNGEVYYARPWNGTWDVEILKTAREHKISALLLGAPGTGKTAMAEAAFGDELMTMVVSRETRESAFIGSWLPSPEGGYHWASGPLLTAVLEGRPILIDEILLADPTVLSSVLYPLMDGRGFLEVQDNPDIGTVQAADGFYIIGSGNPDVIGANLSEALGSRFRTHVEVTTDWDLAITLGAESDLVKYAKTLHTMATGPAASIEWAPQFRELIGHRDLSAVFGREFAYRDLMRRFPKGDLEEVQSIMGNTLSLDLLRPAKI